jgi:hypothetical protein
MAVLPPYRRTQGFRPNPTAKGPLFTLLLERIAAFISGGDGRAEMHANTELEFASAVQLVWFGEGLMINCGVSR